MGMRGVAPLVALSAVWVGGCSTSTEETPEGPVEWRVVFDEEPSALLRVWGTSSSDVYVVGADADGSGPVALHYDGARWRRLRPPVQGDLWWVQGVGPDDVRMVGDDGIALRYTPSTDSFEIRTTPTTLRLFGVWGASSDDVWYVGGDTGRNRGVILRDDGRSVRSVDTTATASAAFFKAQGFGANAVWLVGQRGRTLFWNGAELVEHTTGTFLPLMGVHGQSEDQVFAVGGVGDGVMLSWDGAAWREETPLATPQMIAVWAVDDQLAYAAGFNGRLFRRRSGAWAEVEEPVPTFQDLHALWVDEKGEIWGVGGRLAEDPPTGGVLVHHGRPVGSEVVE